MVLTCTDFQSDQLSFEPLNDDRSSLTCFDASRQIRTYSNSINIHTVENIGVITPAIYHGGNTSSNSHSDAVFQLFQNIGISPIVMPMIQPMLIRYVATFRLMYLIYTRNIYVGLNVLFIELSLKTHLFLDD